MNEAKLRAIIREELARTLRPSYRPRDKGGYSRAPFKARERCSMGTGELATLEEARKFLRVSAKTVRRRLKRGLLPGTKLGNEWRFSWAKLREIAGVTSR